MAEFDAAVARPGGLGADLRTATETLETVANKWLQRYPNASFRENAESFLGTFALVFCGEDLFPVADAYSHRFGATDLLRHYQRGPAGSSRSEVPQRYNGLVQQALGRGVVV